MPARQNAHVSFRDSMHETDVVVIGAGAAGVAAARALGDARIPVVRAGGARARSAGAPGPIACGRSRARSRLRLVAFGRRERVGRARAEPRLCGRRLSAAVGAAGASRRISPPPSRRTTGPRGSASMRASTGGRGGQRPADVGLLRAGRALERHARRDGDLHQRRRGGEDRRSREYARYHDSEHEPAHRARLWRADRGLCGRRSTSASIAR